MTGGSNNNNFLVINNEEKNRINFHEYMLNNNREICSKIKKEEICKSNFHCGWVKNKCYFSVSQEKLIEYVSKVTDEILNNELKSKEILNIDNYYISDIVDIDNFKERDGQKILKSSVLNLNILLNEMFGKANIPIIGKKKINRINKSSEEQNLLNPLVKKGLYYYQDIYNENAIYRAVSNSIYWINSGTVDKIFRNLGYYSDIQTDISNVMRSYIFDVLESETKIEEMYEDLKKILKIPLDVFISEYKNKMFLGREYYYLGIPDLYILNKIYDIPIVAYDNYEIPFIVFDNGVVLNNLKLDEKIDLDEKYSKNTIKIKYNIKIFDIKNSPSYLTVIY